MPAKKKKTIADIKRERSTADIKLENRHQTEKRSQKVTSLTIADIKNRGSKHTQPVQEYKNTQNMANPTPNPVYAAARTAAKTAADNEAKRTQSTYTDWMHADASPAYEKAVQRTKDGKATDWMHKTGNHTSVYESALKKANADRERNSRIYGLAGKMQQADSDRKTTYPQLADKNYDKDRYSLENISREAAENREKRRLYTYGELKNENTPDRLMEGVTSTDWMHKESDGVYEKTIEKAKDDSDLGRFSLEYRPERAKRLNDGYEYMKNMEPKVKKDGTMVEKWQTHPDYWGYADYDGAKSALEAKNPNPMAYRTDAETPERNYLILPDSETFRLYDDDFDRLKDLGKSTKEYDGIMGEGRGRTYTKYDRGGVPETVRVKDDDYYKFITDDDRDAIAYLVGKGDVSAAKKYRKMLQERLNMQQAWQDYEFSDKNTVLQALSGVKTGLQRAGHTIADTVTSVFDEEAEPTSYSEYMSLYIREGLKNHPVAKTVYDLTDNLSYMVPSIIASAGVTAAAAAAGVPQAGAAFAGNVLGAGTMGIMSGSETANAARRSGHGDVKAVTYGLANGSLEGGLQYVLGGIGRFGGKASKVVKNKLSDVITGAVIKGARDTGNTAEKSALKVLGEFAMRSGANQAVSMGSEFTEEYLQEIIDPVVRNVCLGEDNESHFVTEEALYAGLLGALSAGVMETPHSISGARADMVYSGIGKTEGENGNFEQAYAYALNNGMKAADDYKADPSDINAGKLYIEVMRSIGDDIASSETAEEVTERYEAYSDNEFTKTVAAEAARDRLFEITEEAEQEGSADDFTDAASDKVLEDENETDVTAGEDLGFTNNTEKESAEETPAENPESPTLNEMSENARKVMEAGEEYAAGDVTGYRNAFSEYYTYGKEGIAYETADEISGFKEAIAQSAARLAWKTGLKERNEAFASLDEAAKTAKTRGKGILKWLPESEHTEHISAPPGFDTLSHGQKTQVRAACAIAEVTGQNIVIYQSREVNGRISAPNGWFNQNTDTIYLDLNAGDVGENALMRTASHEITHYIRKWSPLKYQTLQDIVLSEFAKTKSLKDAVEGEIKNAADAGISLSREEALDEITANACEMMLKDSDFIQRVADEQPGITVKIREILGNIAEAIKKAFGSVKGKSFAYKELERINADWKNIQKLWDSAVKEAADRSRNAQKELSEADMKKNKDGISFDRRKMKDVGYKKQTGEQTVKYGMSEKERAEILKAAAITVKSNPEENAKNAGIISTYDIESLDKRLYKSKSLMKKMSKQLGIEGKYTVAGIECEFAGGTIEESASAMHSNGKGIKEMTEMLMHTKEILESATVISSHDDLYKGTIREDQKLKRIHVLLGIYAEGNTIVPVEVIVKEREGNDNKIYLETSLNKIGADVITAATPKTVQETPRKAPIEVSVSGIIKNVNSEYGRYLRYFPKEMLNKEQLAAVRAEERKTGIKLDFLKKGIRPTNREVENEYKRIYGNDGTMYSRRTEEESLSAREILAGAMLSIAKTECERANLEEYQKVCNDLNSMEDDVRKLRRDLDLAETAAERDAIGQKIYDTEDLIREYDRMLIDMVHTKPIRDLVRRQTEAMSKERIENMRKRYREQRVSRQNTNLRESIKRISSSLITYITKPTNQKHIPQALKTPVTEFIASIDFISSKASPDSLNSLQWSEKMRRVSDVLRNITANSDESIVEGFDTALLDDMNSFSEENKNVKLSDMNQAQLETLYMTVKRLQLNINNANAMLADKNNTSLRNVAYKTISDLDAGKERIFKESDRSLRKLMYQTDNLFSYSFMDAFHFFDRFGESGTKIRRALTNGWGKKALMIKQTTEAFEKIREETGTGLKDIEKWGKADDKSLHVFDLPGRGKLRLTTLNVMELYLLSKRKAARSHIQEGAGIKVKDIERGGIVKGSVSQRAVRLTKADIDRIISVLDGRQTAFADGLQKYLSGTMAQEGNKTSMKMYGYEKFDDPNYWPMKVVSESTDTKPGGMDAKAGLYSVVNMGITKELKPNANDALEIGNVIESFVRNCVDMSTYASMAPALTDAMKWYNFKEFDEATGEKITVKGSIKRRFGEAALRYFERLMLDLNNSGSRSMEDTNALMIKLAGQYKAQAVAGNIRVAVQQPLAYFRAGNEIDMKYLIKAMKLKKASKEAQERSGTAYWKAAGHFDSALGPGIYSQITGQQKITDMLKEKTMYLAGKADDLTWGRIWLAVKYEVEEKNRGINTQSEEFFEKVNERFDDVIGRTQVVDSPFHTSQVMKDKGAYVNVLLPFMSEPIRNVQQMSVAIHEKNWKKFGKAAALFAVEAVTNTAVTSFIDAARRGLWDEDKEYMERYAESFINNLSGNMPWNQVPIVKDIIDTLKNYDKLSSGNENMALASVNSLAEFMNTYRKYTLGKTTEKNLTNAALRLASTASGIPFYNLKRDSEALYDTLANDVLNHNRKGSMIEEAAEAKCSGNMSGYEKIVNELKKDGMDEQELLGEITREANKRERENDSEKKESKKKELYTASDLRRAAGTGKVSEIQIVVDYIEHKARRIGEDELKSKKSAVKGVLGKYYKSLPVWDRKVFADRLKRINFGGVPLYDDKAIEGYEKAIAEKKKK